jgi:hypothetical protein
VSKRDRRGYFRFVPMQLAEGRPLAEQLLKRRSLLCICRKHLGQMKTRTAHLAIRPDLKISDREVFEKGVGFYYLLAL